MHIEACHTPLSHISGFPLLSGKDQTLGHSIWLCMSPQHTCLSSIPGGKNIKVFVFTHETTTVTNEYGKVLQGCANVLSLLKVPPPDFGIHQCILPGVVITVLFLFLFLNWLRPQRGA